MPWLYLLEELRKARGVPAHCKGSGERARDFGALTVEQVKEECNDYTDCELA